MAEAIISQSSRSKKFAPDDLEPPFDVAVHLRTPPPSEEQQAKIVELRSLLGNHAKHAQLFRNHANWADDKILQKFLIARNYKINDSLSMIIDALQWRDKRKPGEIDTKEGWEEKMSKESETGKIYCPGHDRWKRPILVFDNTVQNTPHVDDHMTFLAWNLEFSIKLMPPGTDKYLVFMHLENFSFWNTPPFAATRETIHMLCTCFPERLGHCIAYRPPGIFRTFFETVKGFLDPRTANKMIFVTGDVSDGSDNDNLMRSIIGDDWKELTGAEQPQPDLKVSPGYAHHKFWPTVTERMEILKTSTLEGAPADVSPAAAKEIVETASSEGFSVNESAPAANEKLEEDSIRQPETVVPDASLEVGEKVADLNVN